MNYSSATIAGNLTRDPELRTIPSSGNTVTTFAIAVNKRRGQEDKTSFFEVVVFGKMGENCERFLRKGALVLVSGDLEVEDYETRDGEKRRQVKVIAKEVVFGPRRDSQAGNETEHRSREDYGRGGDQARSEPRREPTTHNSKETEDDLPF